MYLTLKPPTLPGPRASYAPRARARDDWLPALFFPRSISAAGRCRLVLEKSLHAAHITGDQA